MLDFILRALIVGGLATCAAWLFERALRNAGLAVRHAWTGALIATTTLPFLPRLFETSSTLPVPVITLPAISFTSTAVSPDNPVDYVRLAWILFAVVVASVYAIAYARLLRARRGWTHEVVAEHDVDISDRFGPAIFGFIRPRIVVPQWIRAAEREEQKLIVRHEREHIEAGDHLQLLLTLIATVVMPWNPFVWLQARRLRFALEADCDRRVLAAMPDRERYATLLVDVGSRQMGLFLTPALAEHRNGLERRIIMLAETVRRNWLKAGGLAVLGIGITIVACESRLPQESAPDVATAVTTEEPQRMKSEGNPAPFPTVSELMARHYPPALRDAGIGGTVTVQARIYASGKVERVGVVKSSGNPALDAAGAKVLNDMQILPSKSANGTPQNMIENYSLEFAPTRKIESLEPTQRPAVQDQQSKPRTTGGPVSLPPELKQLIDSEYPPLLRKAGIGGEVTVELKIGGNGYPENIRVVKGSGHGALDAAAERVAKKMRFGYPGQTMEIVLHFRPAGEENVSDRPMFTPYTKPPELINREETSRALVRAYPAELRDAGIGSTAVIWVLVDETGHVVKTAIKTSSGQAELDDAARAVGNIMKFSPALNGTKPVPVWIALPVVLKTQ